MIRLTAELSPSFLFYFETLSDFAQQLLERASRERELGDLREAEHWAELARQSCWAARAHVHRAAALIYLSDIYREMGKLGPALSYATEACEILRRQAALVERHNEGVAAYNLGMIHHLLGNDREALDSYRLALERLEQARDYWAERKASNHFHMCARLSRWVRALSASMIRGEAYGDFSILLPALIIERETDDSDEEADSISVVQFGVHSLRMNRVVIGDRLFQVKGLTRDGRDTHQGQIIRKGAKYRVFEIPEPARAQVEAQEGDYVLVRRQEEVDLRAPYCVVEESTGPDFGRFERDPDTREIRFKSMVNGKIIGDVASMYFPLALLRPLDRGGA